MTDEEVFERIRELARFRAVVLPEPDERKDIRNRAGLSGREFAAALGVAASTLANWEGGFRQPRGHMRVLYAKALSILKSSQERAHD